MQPTYQGERVSQVLKTYALQTESEMGRLFALVLWCISEKTRKLPQNF